MITAKQIIQIMQCPAARATKWEPYLNIAMEKFNITTPARIAAFLAQIGHESGRLVYVREIWCPSTSKAQATYEGRADLGNVEPGDGRRFLGRGLIQITGRANYIACDIGLKKIFPELLDNHFIRFPETLEHPKFAAASAGWYWADHGCNEMSDAGDFKKITRRINGGLNGYEDRVALFNQANSILQPITDTGIA